MTFGERDSIKMTGSTPTPDNAEAPHQGLREKVMKGGAFLIGRQLISMGLSLIGVLMITRIIGPEKYGAYAAALGIYQYVQNLGQVGIGVYLVRAKDQASEREYHVATTLLLMMAGTLVVAIEGGMSLISAWVHVAGFEDLLTFLAIALPFQVMGVAASARLERALDFRRVAMIELTSQLAYYVVALPLVLTDHGPWSLVAGWCTQQICSCILFHLAARYVPRLVWDRGVMRQMLGYTLGFSAANWLWQLRNLVNPMIVGHFLGAQAVGYVGMGIRMVELLAFAKTIAWRLSVAALARIQDKPEKLVEATTQGMQLQTLAIGPVLLGFSWVGGWILPLVFGDRWAPVMVIYPFIALSYLTNAQFNVHSSVLYVLRRNWDVSLFHIVHVTLFAAGAWVAIEYWGLVGYGWGEVAALLSYATIHWSVARAVGSPDYKISIIWWIGLTLGLFWRELGWWAFAAPFLAILWPDSIRQLRFFLTMIRGRRRAA